MISPGMSKANQTIASAEIALRCALRRACKTCRLAMTLTILFQILAVNSLSIAAALQDNGESPSQGDVQPPGEIEELNRVHGIANVDTDGKVQLSSVVPRHRIDWDFTLGVMVGTIEFSLKRFSVVGAAALGPTIAIYDIVDLLLTAGDVGLTQAHERTDAELYVLDDAANELKKLVQEVKENGNPPNAESKARFEQLKERLNRLKGDFEQGSTTGGFVKKAVFDADLQVAMNEASVFAEFFFSRWLKRFLGRLGNWFFQESPAAGPVKWVWRDVKSELRGAMGKGVWNRWKLNSRLRNYALIAQSGAFNWSSAFTAKIFFPRESAPREYYIQVVSTRVNKLPLAAPPPEPKVFRIEATNPLQAISLIQNLEFSPKQLASRQPVDIEIIVKSPSQTQSDTTYRAMSSADGVTQSQSSPPAAYQTQLSKSTFHVNDSFAFKQARYIDRVGRGTAIGFDTK